MTVANVIVKIDEEVVQILKEYDATTASKDSEGTRIAHILDTVTDPEKLAGINKALLTTTLECKPRDLWRLTATDVDPKMYDIDSTNYVKVPTIATNTGDDLDMDEALAQGVIFYSVLMLWSGNDRYAQKAESVFKNYNAVQKQYDLAIAQGN